MLADPSLRLRGLLFVGASMIFGFLLVPPPFLSLLPPFPFLYHPPLFTFSPRFSQLGFSPSLSSFARRCPLPVVALLAGDFE